MWCERCGSGHCRHLPRLHDDAAAFQLPDDAREKFLHHGFYLGVLVVVIVLLLGLLLARIAALLMLMLLLIPIMLRVPSAIVVGKLRWHRRSAAGQVDVHAAGVLLGRVLQTQLLADLLDPRFDLLDVVCGVIASADDAVKLDFSRGGGVFFSYIFPSGGDGVPRQKHIKGTYTWRCVCPVDCAYRIRCSRMSSASWTNCPCRSIVSPSTRPTALFSRKM